MLANVLGIIFVLGFTIWVLLRPGYFRMRQRITMGISLALLTIALFNFLASFSPDYTLMVGFVTAGIVSLSFFGIYPLRGRIALRLAKWRLEQRNIKAALTLYDYAVMMHPTSAEAYFQRGSLLFTVREFTLARLDFDATLDLQPDVRLMALAYTGRGSTFLAQRDFEAALQNYQTALETTFPPSFIAIFHHERGYCYALMGRLEASLQDCNYALENIVTQTQLGYAYANRGHTHFLMGDYLKALNDFERAVKHKSDIFAWVGQAVSNHAMGRIEEAQRLWTLVCEQEPSYRDFGSFELSLPWGEAFHAEAEKLAKAM